MSHTHGPGEEHSHSHGPQPPAQQQQQQQQQQFIPPQPDPKAQALIDADYQPVNLKLGPPDNAQALCAEHSLEKCEACGIDFAALNHMARIFVQNPTLMCPPPPQVIQQQRSQAVNKAKEDGNVLLKAGKVKEAISMYTMAASVASQRLPWENNALMREELSTVLGNRAQAYITVKDYISALADAETVTQLKRNWNKGHFRKARALEELGHLAEAKESLQLGLAFEPDNADLQNLLNDIDKRIKKKKGQ